MYCIVVLKKKDLETLRSFGILYKYTGILTHDQWTNLRTYVILERVRCEITKLMNGYIVKKSEESVNYGVNERSIQRDIDDIRNYLDLDSE